MKLSFLALIIVMVFNTGFSQSERKTHEQSSVVNKSNGLPANVYYLSASGAISDAEIGMNSIKFGTDNTSVIQNVLDKAKNSPITVYWDGRYSVTGLKISKNKTAECNMQVP
jgi:hypothetical protein